MPLIGADLGDSIKTTIDAFTAGLVGPYTAENVEQRRVDLMRAVGEAIVAYVTTAGAPGASIAGLVPATGGASGSYVLRADGTWGAPTTGPHMHPTSDVSGLDAALAALAPLASPALTGAPTAPTASPGTNNTQLATTAFVRNEVTALVASSPTTLDTLDELAAALGDDPNFATSVATSIGGKQPLHAMLTMLAALDGTAGIWRQTGTNTVVRLSDTPAGRAILEAADAAAQRTALGLGTAATHAHTDYAAASHTHAESDITGLSADLTKRPTRGQVVAATMGWNLR